MAVSITPHHSSSEANSLLVQELQAQVSELTHAQLTLRLKIANDALASVSTRNCELCKELTQVDAAVRRREVALMIERGCIIDTDTELTTLRPKQERIKAALHSLVVEEEASKQVRAVLRGELEIRATELDREVTRRVQANWKGRDTAAREAARKAFAESICAYAHERTTAPQGVQAFPFLEQLLGEGAIYKLVQDITENERAKERTAIVKRNPRFGEVR